MRQVKVKHAYFFLTISCCFALMLMMIVFPIFNSIRNSTAYPVAGPLDLQPLKLFDLHRITDPINELVVDKFKRLHDGIYRTKARLSDGSGDLVFAFKAECRPVLGMHGQQGWPEISMAAFQKLFIQNDTAPYPRSGYARGVVVAITKWHYWTAFEFDRCGLITDAAMVERALGRKLLRGAERRNNHGNPAATILLIGVAITWEERFTDSYFPQAPKYAPYFVVPPSAVDLSGTRVSRHELHQMSDVFAFDYILFNPDRHIAMGQNWFLDKATKTQAALLDNGWDFGGDDFNSSVCRVESQLIDCPSPMEGWTRSKFRHLWSCRPPERQPTVKRIEWCRFRPETLQALSRTRRTWHSNGENADGSGGLASRWTEMLLADPLISFLLNAYGSKVERHVNNTLYSEALGRYIQDCPPRTGQELNAPGTEKENMTAMVPSTLLRFLQLGLKARMDRLASHAEGCLSRYGESYVYGFGL